MLPKMHFQSQKQLSDLELKVDNANANFEAQIEQLNEKVTELITQNEKCKA